MGDNPPQAVNSHLPQAGERDQQWQQMSIFNLIAGAEDMETPLPYDYLTSIKPLVRSCLHLFRRYWLKEMFSNNALNIFVLPFITKPKLARLPLILS